MIADGGTNYTISLRADSTALHRLSCSVKNGCQVIVPPDDVRSVTLTDSRIEYKVVPSADGLHVLLLPTAALVNDGGVVSPLEGMLRVILSGHEYDVMVTAKDIPESYTMAFEPSPQAVAVPRSVTPEVTHAADGINKLDPAEMDFGWKSLGSPRKCVSVFSYQGFVWCKLPPEVASIPTAVAVEGKLQRPLNLIVVDRQYLKIEGMPEHIRLIWAEDPGQDVFIQRDRE